MTKTPPAASSNTRLAIGGLAILAACLCVGVASALAWNFFGNRGGAGEPAVEYILDASPRMAASNPVGQDSRLSVARAVLAEIVRPADGRVTAGLRVFGNGTQADACRDTALLVPLAPANQARIATELNAIEAGTIADAAMAEAMIAAIRDLSDARGPHTLVVVTGGLDSCNPQAGQLIAEEAARANIELETFVVGYQVLPEEAEAIRGLVSEVPGGTFLEAHDRAGLDMILKAIQARVDKPETTTVDSIIATAVALPPAATPGLNLGLDEAADIVEEEVIKPDSLDHGLLLFPWAQPIDPDDLLLPFASLDLGTPPDPIPVPGPSWFFWIDDQPAGKFAHPNRFVLVDIGTGAVTVHEQQWWPVLNGESLWVNPADYWNPENWGFDNFDGNPVGFPAARAPGGAPLARPEGAPLARQGAAQAVALVMNGWQAGEAGATALTLDGASVRAAFIHSGLATTYLGPASDANRDGDYSPAALATWMSDKAVGLIAGDTLVVYLTGHGDGTALAGLSPAALQAALRSINAGVHVIVILDSSYSGAFIPALSTSADRLITATNADTPALFDVDPVNDPNGATDTGSEFTSGFVEDWEGILNDPAELAAALARAVAETRPLWDVLAELSFHSAVAKDAGAAAQQTVPQMVPAQQPTPTPTQTPTETATPTATATLVPLTATFTRRPPTPTFTPVPAPVLNFNADTLTVAAGQCTTLRWDSANLQSLLLDNQSVDGAGTRQVCPTITTTYTLVGNYAGGQVSRQLTITFQAPSTPPNFGSADVSNDEWYDAAGCGPVEVQLFINLNNATSGMVFYRVQPVEAAPSAWSSRPLTLLSGTTWTRTLTIPDMPLDNGIMQYYYTATNAAGTSQSIQFGDVLYHSCKP